MFDHPRLQRSKLAPAELDVARRLRAMRMQKRFTVPELAALAGVTRAALQHWEYGEAPLPFRAGDAVCRVMGVHQPWLAHGGEITAPWLDLSAFPVGSATLEAAGKLTLLEACAGPLKPAFDQYRETHPLELIVEQRLAAGPVAALREMSRFRLRQFVADSLDAAWKSSDARVQLLTLRLAKDAISEMERRISGKNPFDETNPLAQLSPVQIADRLKQKRASLGLTQEQAAKSWGVPVTTLRNWEQGKRQPRGLAMRQLEMILHTAGTPGD